MSPWQSEPIRVAKRSDVTVDVRASAEAVVLAQGDGVWVSNYLLQPDDVMAFSADVQQAAIHCRAMRMGS